MQEWFSPKEILEYNQGELPDRPDTLNRHIDEHHWRECVKLIKKAPGRGGGWLYHISLLPQPIQKRIRAAQCKEDLEKDTVDPLWQRYEKLSDSQKEQCQHKLSILQEVEDLASSGFITEGIAAYMESKHGVAISTIFSWKKLVKDVPRDDWLAALAPASNRNKGKSRVHIHPDAWEALKSDYLRNEGSKFAACYRRMKNSAAENGWGKIPIERTLRRRLEREVPAQALVHCRKGANASKALYPSQKRTRSHLHVMQAVNVDGHVLDVFVKLKDASIGRLCLIAIQDLFSNKYVAWRLSYSENKETLRLAIGDMVEKYGIPEDFYMDNGRANASKWISGQMKTRYRFKIRDEDPKGLLKILGIEGHFTKPASGQSKPIERSFLDFCESIAKHPKCAGAYTGNSPDNKPANYGSRAIDEAEFRDFVDKQIRRHNAQEDRNTENAKGISFNKAFKRSYEKKGTIVRQMAPSQKVLWLLAAEQVTARKGNGELHFHGNRYWHPAMTGYAAKKVVVRFDPDNLQQPLKVIDATDRLICEASLFVPAEFDNVEAAKEHERARNRIQKANRELAALHRKLPPRKLAKIYDTDVPEEEPMRPAIPRLFVAPRTSEATARKPEEWNDETEESLGRALRLYFGKEE